VKTIPIHPIAASFDAATPAGGGVARRLKIRVLRYNPQQPGTVPHWQTYELDDAAGMTLFIALSEIREKLDPSLQFDFVCRAGICGSCFGQTSWQPSSDMQPNTPSSSPTSS